MVPPHCFTYQRNHRADTSWGSDVTFTLTNSLANLRTVLKNKERKGRVTTQHLKTHITLLFFCIWFSLLSGRKGYIISCCTWSSRFFQRAAAWTSCPTPQHVVLSKEPLWESGIQDEDEQETNIWQIWDTTSRERESKKNKTKQNKKIALIRVMRSTLRRASYCSPIQGMENLCQITYKIIIAVLVLDGYTLNQEYV